MPSEDSLSAPLAAPEAVAAFVSRWSESAYSERSNCQSFVRDLCDLLKLPRPDPAGDDTRHNAYVFERAVPLHHHDRRDTTGQIDLYKRGCFVLEAKQYGAAQPDQPEFAMFADPGLASRKKGIVRDTFAWDQAMLKARGQAERYAHNLPAEEEPPVFLLVVDVGHVFELYADFTQKGKAYLPFPDARSHRIRLARLAEPEIQELFRTIWTDPASLDPSRKAAAVTREVAGHLAELARLFEKDHEPAVVAAFLSRCLFCMFAEDVGLLPKDSFSELLDSVKDDPGAAVPLLRGLFGEMNKGGYSLALRKTLLLFNGGLFADQTVLPLDGMKLGLLRRAARLEWRQVEPAIFGTLLERALDPRERHKLGAHYTPRSYVERLVLPTVVEPLRAEWEAVRSEAVRLANRGDRKTAITEVQTFHHHLCSVRVLDPACGSGNFLYVTLEHLKRLEGEVLDLVESFGENLRLGLDVETVDPHQFLGIEINPRAATIAELVLWIGYLQWHHRNRGETDWPEPVLRKFHNIECRDAVLAYEGNPQPVTWQMAESNNDLPGLDPHLHTRFAAEHNGIVCNYRRNEKGETELTPLLFYKNARSAEWPDADFIVGNPPFIGNKRMRDDLGAGYTETLRNEYPDVLEGADFVMFWWYKAALLVNEDRVKRFGFITTNSLRQSSNRSVVAAVSNSLSQQDDPRCRMIFAIPDHPWVDEQGSAAVRIAMSVAARDSKIEPLLAVVTEETPGADGESVVRFENKFGSIHADLSVGAAISELGALRSNKELSFMGVSLIGNGFLVPPDLAAEFYVKPFIIGRDLNQMPEAKFVIDFFGLKEEEARIAAPLLFEIVAREVKPMRETNNRKGYRENWWLYGEQRTGLRTATEELSRFIVTCRTARHRLFTFVSGETIPESTIIAISTDDAFHLGALSSRIHVLFSLSAGSRLGIGNDPRYNNSLCFAPFPFPDCTEVQKNKIRGLAETLDAHRKTAQAKHGLGLTAIYNVLEKLRAREELTPKERKVHDAALVSTLRQLHDELDAAVAEAYGWDWPLEDDEILTRLVALNAKRAAEEAEGHVRWLRPDYQIPRLTKGKESGGQGELGLASGTRKKKKKAARKAAAKKQATRPGKKLPWPKRGPERIKLIVAALDTAPEPITAEELATRFARAKPEDVLEILESLEVLGRAHRGDTPETWLR